MAMPGSDFHYDDGPYTACEECGAQVRVEEAAGVFGYPLCAACWERAQTAEDTHCALCGQALDPDALSASRVCSDCRRDLQVEWRHYLATLPEGGGQ